MKTKIIAEIASCHNGDIELAKKMVQVAAQAGVDIVKFQSWQAKNVADDDPDKKRYQSLELSDEAHKILVEECKKNNVEFLTTCFDKQRIPFLKELGLNKIKVASFDLKSYDLLQALKENFEEVIVSTGQSFPEEIQKAADIFDGKGIVFLHCVSIYPCPLEKANLNRMLWLKQFSPEVGYSDHTFGSDAGKLAIGMGAKYVEKHFTLDRNTPQMGHTTTTKSDAKQMTTHEMADEPPVFKDLADFNKKAQLMLSSTSLEPDKEELFHREKYTNRLNGKNE